MQTSGGQDHLCINPEIYCKKIQGTSVRSNSSVLPQRKYQRHLSIAMATSLGARKPTSIQRPKRWSEEVEEAYRLQLAGYRDALEYHSVKGEIDRWPKSGYIKKLQRKDGNYYYYNRSRECADKDVNKIKLYGY
ncbi:meiosis expressed gene 1 protein homolog isoform X2 [Patiria miniata]|uniref:Meiosis expressed gene 1 protein homolog n=1 Tax=Patiria miniata TaxID=46514 RepID=A0A914ADC8_PATMI|nr:meiosis expressed gene 1 protein homolog isoform X2 [Patiria miniata]